MSDKAEKGKERKDQIIMSIILMRIIKMIARIPKTILQAINK